MRKRYAVIGALAVLLAGAAPFAAAGPQASPPKQAVATGTGGAAATVDPDATQTAIQILRRGGNAIDAAVAANATLGVTEPYVAAIGGGGFMVVYLAKQHRVITIDGREKAPRRLPAGRLHRPGDRPAVSRSRRSGSRAAWRSACPGR